MNGPDITAAPSEVVIGDEVFLVSPMQDKDYGEFERWVQDRYLDVATRNAEKIPEGNRDVWLQHAYDRAAAITITSDEALKIMVTVEGSARMFWLSTRRNHPDLTYDRALQLLTDPVNLARAMSRIKTLNGGITRPKAARRRATQKARRRQKR